MKLFTKKIVSLFAAIAMISTMFGVFATAEDTIGYSMVYDEEASDKNTAVIKVEVTGLTALTGGNMTIPVDDEVFDTSKLTSDGSWWTKNTSFGMGSANYIANEGIIKANYVGGATDVSLTDNVIYTFTLPLLKPVTSAKTLTMTAGGFTANKVVYTIGAEENGIEAPEAKIPVDSSTPPAPPVRPGEETVPTQPDPVDPQPETGYNIVLDEDATDLSSQVVFDVVVKGITALTGGNMTIPVDDEVFDTSKLTSDGSWWTKNASFGMGSANYIANEGIIKANYVAGASDVTLTDNVIYTFTLPLLKPITSYTDITMTAGGYTANKVAYAIGAEENGLTAPILRVEALKEEPEVVKTVGLKDFVGKTDDKDGATIAKEAEDAGKTVYMTVDVKLKDGSLATYGTDYAAVYNGKVLGSEEFNNIIHGYTEESIADVINGLTFNIYNSKVAKISTTLSAVNDETQLVPPVNDKTIGTPPTPKPTPTPSLTVSPTSKSMSYNSIFTLTTTVNNKVEGGTLKYTVDKTTVLEALAGDTYDAATGKGSARFASFEVSDTATITVAYVDAEGKELATKDIKVTVSKSTDGGSTGSGDGDNDNTGGSGIIAPPFGGTATPDPGYKPNFQDLDSVPWAVEAINGLAARGMVKGRSETVFDPNANITRAEYCQMLVNAINAGNAAAQSTYTDVPSDAWYYNAVSVASKLGIVNGLGDGNFGPNELITRQDMAVMTYRAAQSKQINLDPVNDQITFEDSNDIASYAFEAVMTLQKAGIINGMTETTFEPLSNATRAQSAKILYETFVK